MNEEEAKLIIEILQDILWELMLSEDTHTPISLGSVAARWGIPEDVWKEARAKTLALYDKTMEEFYD